ncbi:hypothetical protein CA13_48370 [Planctomycetes bacterium CA13]|uniref:Uncharacterized protein n=1 Tax=Novipirellula herctigrandis TaxID=2527986 RepID=A0A5C5Z7Q0_9BACT|nr:hypothetical protein CA13_48370 [Planctomycetes bacterium CA13]
MDGNWGEWQQPNRGGYEVRLPYAKVDSAVLERTPNRRACNSKQQWDGQRPLAVFRILIGSQSNGAKEDSELLARKSDRSIGHDS